LGLGNQEELAVSATRCRIMHRQLRHFSSLCRTSSAFGSALKRHGRPRGARAAMRDCLRRWDEGHQATSGFKAPLRTKDVSEQLSCRVWGGAAESARWRPWQERSARAKREIKSALAERSDERAARKGTEFRRAVRRYGTASSARDPSTVGFGGATATGPELRSFHSRCTNCAMGRL